jgi:hypothetical protein
MDICTQNVSWLTLPEAEKQAEMYKMYKIKECKNFRRAPFLRFLRRHRFLGALCKLRASNFVHV